MQVFSALLQDEFTLVKDRLRLTLGTKVEHNDYTGFEMQPSARLLWTPGDGGEERHRVYYGSLDVEDLGRVYEALLELEPGKAMLGRKRPPPPVTDFAKFDLEALARKAVTKDTSVANGSSIALLAEFDERAILLTEGALREPSRQRGPLSCLVPRRRTRRGGAAADRGA